MVITGSEVEIAQLQAAFEDDALFGPAVAVYR